MKRTLVLLYGIFAYLMFFGVFLYLIGFVSGFFVPTTVDGGSGTWGLWGNLGLILLFAVQHTLMARSSFKEKLTRWLPASIERSTYVLITSFLLLLIYRFWSPIDGVLWDIQSPLARALLYATAGIGWLVVLISTFLTDHFDLFGLRQVYLYFQKKPYTPIRFKKIAFYKFVRHPLMLGFLIAFWSTPTMTHGHLCFALAMSVYILIGITFEERELIKLHGVEYTDYKTKTRRLLPLPGL